MPETIVQPPPATVPSDTTSGSAFNSPELISELTAAFSRKAVPNRGLGEIVDDPSHAHDDPDDARMVETNPETKPAPKPSAKTDTKPSPLAKPETPATPNAKSWKDMNAERLALKEETTRLSSQLKELQDKSSGFEKLQKDYEQLDQVVKQGFQERDPRIIGPLKQRIDGAIALAKTVIPAEQAERVAQLLQQPESDWRTNELESIVTNLSPLRQGKFLEAVNEIDRASRERSALAGRSEEWLQARAAEVRQHQQAERDRLLKTFDHVQKSWASELPMYQKREGDDAHNSSVDDLTAMARNIYSGRLQSPEDLAKASMWAAAAPKFLEGMRTLQERLSAVEKENEELRSGGPGLAGGNGSGGGETTDPDVKPDSMSYGDWIAHLARKSGAFK